MLTVVRRRRRIYAIPPPAATAAGGGTGLSPKGLKIKYGFKFNNLGKALKFGSISHTTPAVIAAPRPRPLTILYGVKRPEINLTSRVIRLGLKRIPPTAPFTGWRHIQDQLDAGYPIYIEPAADTGSYVETFDFGVIYTNIIVNINYDYTLIVGGMNIGFSTEISTDGISWGAPSSSLSFFSSALRYARVTVSFDGTDNKSLLEFFNFRIALNVRLENDGGQITANSADASGTVVTFTKPFKRIVSITLTSKQLHPVTMIYDFSFPPNPTTFKVLAFDSSGNRITEDITWAARGVI